MKIHPMKLRAMILGVVIMLTGLTVRADEPAPGGAPPTPPAPPAAPSGLVMNMPGDDPNPPADPPPNDPTPGASDPPPADPPAGDPPTPGNEPPADPPAGDSWLTTLPAEYQENPNFTKFKSLEEFAKSHENLVRMASRKGLERPADDASPEVWSEFWNRVGRPESPEGYDWKPPANEDGSPVEMMINDDQLQKVKETFHGLGLDNPQFKAIMDMYVQDSTAQAAAAEEAKVRAEAQDRNDLFKTMGSEWGEAANTNFKIASTALQAHGLESTILKLGLENKPETYRLGLDLARKLGESKVNTNDTPLGAQDKITQIRQSEAFQNRNHPGHQAAKQALNAAYKEAYKE